MQSLAVVFLVAGCFVYAAWTLMPRRARKAIAGFLTERRLPAFATSFLRRHADAAEGCSCDGCDRAAAKPPTAVGSKPLIFHPPRRRS